ncbi:MAG: 50S ribosomal protein L24 [Candidatus Dojkabacteria bacterium]
MNKIKKGDLVQVMRGKDAGKRAEVERVILKEGKTSVIIKGVNVVKRAQKPNPQFGIQGGITQFEKPIDISNVMFVDKKTDKPTRVGIRVDEKTGKKVRFAKKSGEVI